MYFGLLLLILYVEETAFHYLLLTCNLCAVSVVSNICVHCLFSCQNIVGRDKHCYCVQIIPKCVCHLDKYVQSRKIEGR